MASMRSIRQFKCGRQLPIHYAAAEQDVVADRFGHFGGGRCAVGPVIHSGPGSRVYFQLLLGARLEHSDGVMQVYILARS